jgi:L-fuconolactonase
LPSSLIILPLIGWTANLLHLYTGGTIPVVNRRTFLQIAAGFEIAEKLAKAEPVPIIDTHIHLFDPTRPQGVPWPPKDDVVLYHTALPSRYRQVTKGLGVVGSIEIECSPWLEDNQWVLDIAAKDSIIVGTVGDLDPADPHFHDQLTRFHRNPLFRGIRYGNLWGRDLSAGLTKPVFVSGLKAMAEEGLVLDTANPDPKLISAVVRLTDLVPRLRVIVDHLPQLEPPTDAGARKRYEADLRELGKRPQVYIKVSEVLRRVNHRVPQDLGFYRSRLDELWEIFGQDRLIYGSDWPNSDQWAPYPEVLHIVRKYFTGKGPVASEKYFWRNSIAAYHWIKRDATQPS